MIPPAARNRAITTACASFLAMCVANAAFADGCDTMTAKVIAATGARFERAASVHRHLAHPDAQSLSVACPYGSDESVNYANNYDVFLNWDGPFPEQKFFSLGGKAGAVLTGDAPAQVGTAMCACHEKALRMITPAQTDGSVDELVCGKAAVECHVFKRDGGGAAFTIYRHFSQGGR